MMVLSLYFAFTECSWQIRMLNFPQVTHGFQEDDVWVALPPRPGIVMVFISFNFLISIPAFPKLTCASRGDRVQL